MIDYVECVCDRKMQWNSLGYECVVFWEHEVYGDKQTLRDRVSNFINS